MIRPSGLLAIAALAVLAACGHSAPGTSSGGEREGPHAASASAPAGETGSVEAGSAEVGSVEGGSPERGRDIYLRGVSPSGAELTAEVGMRGGAVVPAASLPCVNCHGRDGRGRPEGGVTPSNVRWESLSRPYEVREAGGRAHPPYDERLAGRAVTMGVDPAGQKLDDTMPRYRLTRRDLADLLAYLKKLSTERDPGLSDTEIRIGTLIPSDGPLAPSGAAVRTLLAAFFADLDERGGLYGRRIELVTGEIPASGEGPERPREVQRFLDGSRPFALTAVLLGGDDQPIATLLESQEVPVIAAVTLQSRTASPPARAVFHLYGGLAEQESALATFAARQAPSPGHPPLVLLPGALVGDDVFRASPALAERIRVAFPVLPSDRTPEAMSDYHRLAERYHLTEAHLAAQLSALASAKVLVEALTRAGREASRERLIESTESLRDYRTGLTPPLTYGKNRRTGTAGAHIVKPDPKTGRFVPVAPWIASD